MPIEVDDEFVTDSQPVQNEITADEAGAAAYNDID